MSQPSTDALEHSQHMAEQIRQTLSAAGGWISFAQFMGAALYTPNWGYYTTGTRKFGSAGDFVTAPELTPLFGRALARQAAQVMALSQPHILEAGAGSGWLAVDLLQALEEMGSLPEHYYILDISTDLRARQKSLLEARVPHLLSRVSWLDSLPEKFSGLVLGNELLDAMPVHCVTWQGETILEKGVSLTPEGAFCWAEQPATGPLLEAAKAIAEEVSLPMGFSSEVALAAPAWGATWGERLEQGSLLLIDYGFPRREFYHPQRHEGTLMCHYQHHTHPDPFYLPGLQDITAHVDFTGIIAAASATGLELQGYTNQGQFLLNCGLLQDLEKLGPGSMPYIKASSVVGKLISPHEMGELFKVIAIGRGISAPLSGFVQGDKSHTL